MARPTGTIPCDRPAVCPPAHAERIRRSRTRAPRSRSSTARVDYDYPDGRKLSFSGGVSGTDGIMHTGIGPFDITSGTVMGYAQGELHEAGLPRGLLHQHPERRRRQPADQRRRTGKPIAFNFDTSTYDFEASNVQTFAAKHVVSYGGNLRFNRFRSVDRPGRRQPRGIRRLRAGRDLPLARCSGGSSARASITSTT